jgi:hypothetical protein
MNDIGDDYVALCGYGVDDWYDGTVLYDCDDWM